MVLLQFSPASVVSSENNLRIVHVSFSAIFSPFLSLKKIRRVQVLLDCEIHGINNLNAHIMRNRIFVWLQRTDRGKTLNSFLVAFVLPISVYMYIVLFDPVKHDVTKNRKTFERFS